MMEDETRVDERTPIDTWELSVRTNNALDKYGIKYEHQLTSLSLKEVFKWKNVGKISINEIRRYLAKRDLSLKDEIVNLDIKKMILEDLPGILRAIDKQVNEATHELRYFSYKLQQITEECEKQSKKYTDSKYMYKD